jgi:hypothetical protein
MSWRNLVKLIAQHGPMTANQAQLHTTGDVRAHIAAAGREGLLVMPGKRGGRKGDRAPWVYRLSRLGELWVQGKAVYTAAPQTRPGARPGMCVRPSWLASLPPPNEIRLQSQHPGAAA